MTKLEDLKAARDAACDVATEAEEGDDKDVST